MDLKQSEGQYKGRQTEEILTDIGSVVGMLGLFGGRKSRSLSGVSTAASKRRMTSAAQANMAESKADIARYQAQIDDLKSQMELDANGLTEQWAKAADDIQQTKIAPKKTDIDVQTVALAWAPTWEVTYEDARGRSRTDAVPAYPTQEA